MSSVEHDPTVSAETSHVEVMKKLMEDETFADVTLRGNDGKDVKAVRCMLGAKSTVFFSMLYGEFSESTKDLIPLDFTGSVLQDLVQYIYTDTADVFKFKGADVDVETVQRILSLASAAEYFQLPNLKGNLQRLTLPIIRRQPPMACAFLAGIREMPSCGNEEMEVLLWTSIRRSPCSAMKGVVLEHLPASLLKETVQDDKVVADELDLFRIVQAWSDVDPTNRKKVAMDMVTHLRLEQIDTSDLSSIVRPSGLVTESQVCDAFQAQAAKAHALHGISYKKKRAQLIVWKKTQECSFLATQVGVLESDTLDCPLMKCGVSSWSILVAIEGEDPELRMGIASGSSVHSITLSDGRIYSESKRGRRVEQGRFGMNCKVTFTLNLRPDTEHNGSLTAIVDDRKLLVASNLLSSSVRQSMTGFVPFASIRRLYISPAQLQIITYKQLE